MESTTELLLRPGRRRHAAFAALCAASSAVALLMIQEAKPAGWFCLALFGPATLFFVLQMVPGVSHLRVREDGLIVRNLFRETSYKWSEISGFAPGLVGGNRAVVFDFTEEYRGHPRLRRFAKAVSGGEAALPDTYGYSADRLAELLNQWKLGVRRLDP